METKRCVYCHKLQRADVQVCSRCGHAFVQKKPRSMREWTQPSIPPASPHRAGHYSGLHPEDQPYQSNKVAVQYPTIRDNEDWQRSLPEPEHIIFPVTDPAVRRRENVSERYEDPSAVEFPVIEGPLFYERRRSFLPRRAIPALLALSCIFFLLASSILVVVLIKRSASTPLARMEVSPSTVRVHDTLTLSGSGFGTHHLVAFTYDMNQAILTNNKHPLTLQTGSQGNFSIQLQVPSNWSPGTHSIHATDQVAKVSISMPVTLEAVPTTPPVLQISTANLAFGVAVSGTTSDKIISLMNSGGGQIVWHLSSDQAWLTASPGRGMFSGRENVHVLVNRKLLAPDTYIGHITFIPENERSNTPLTITVTMQVKAPAMGPTVAPPANSSLLVVTPLALSFSITVGQSSVLKAIILQNTGTQSLTWSATVSTMDQGQWLTAEPSSGTLDAGIEGYMNAAVNVQGLKPGTYQGTLTFSSGSSRTTQQVAIVLTVS